MDMSSLPAVGFLYDAEGESSPLAAALVFDERGLFIRVPLAPGVTDGFDDAFRESELPGQVRFRDVNGWSVLIGIRSWERKGSSTGLGMFTMQFNQLVRAGRMAPDYTELHGIRSEIGGLPGFMAPKVFSSEWASDDGRPTEVTFKVTKRPAVDLPGVEGVSLHPHFNATHSMSGGAHTMSETVQVVTRFTTAKPWSAHVRLHRAMQDLVSIAFWWPCHLTIQRGLRDDDTDHVDGLSMGDTWRDVIVPLAGRTIGDTAGDPMPQTQRPLFTMQDIGREGVAKWISDYDTLGQVTWVLASSLFRRGGTVEIQLLQIGTALEALGYFIAVRDGLAGGTLRTPPLPEMLRLLAEDVDCSLVPVLKNHETIAEWVAAFNATYKGVKHADNEFPDPNDARDRADEGALLARLWLARYLGVERATLENRLNVPGTFEILVADSDGKVAEAHGGESEPA